MLPSAARGDALPAREQSRAANDDWRRQKIGDPPPRSDPFVLEPGCNSTTIAKALAQGARRGDLVEEVTERQLLVSHTRASPHGCYIPKVNFG
jgi:hypothetical protein